MTVYRGAAGGMSDHYPMEARVRMKGFFINERKEMLGGRVVKVSELEKVEVREAFKQLVMNEWEKVRYARVLSVE